MASKQYSSISPNLYCAPAGPDASSLPGAVDRPAHLPYKKGMPEIARQVLADPVLVGMIALAVFLNVGALGLKWDHRREKMASAEPQADRE